MRAAHVVAASLLIAGAVPGGAAQAQGADGPQRVALTATVARGHLNVQGWTGKVRPRSGGGVAATFTFRLPRGYHLATKSTDSGAAVVVQDARGRDVAGLDDPIAVDAASKLVHGTWTVTGARTVDLSLPAPAAGSSGEEDFALNVNEIRPDRTTTSPPVEVRAAAAQVSVPNEYIYDPTLGSLHDYCTASPDSWGKADFRGPCARHDMCYEAKEKTRAVCNSALKADLLTNCAYAYGQGVAGAPCRGVAGIYYAAVSAAHP